MDRKNLVPEGTRDLFFGECIIREDIIKRVKAVFKGFGYSEVITPTIEYYTTFSENLDSLREEELYKFFDNKGRIMVLRSDMTIPIGRVVGSKLKDVKTPIRLSYTSNIFRVHESLGGKRNEFTDCGVELIGLSEENSDLEILVTALETLKSLGIKEYKMEIGNINLYNGALKSLCLNDIERSHLAKLIEDKRLKELDDYLEGLKFSKEVKEYFLALPWLFGKEDVLNKGMKLAFNSEIENSLKYIKEIYTNLCQLGYKENITLDLGMVPGVNYYTGLIFKGYVEGVGQIVLRGGRYDTLLKGFGRDEKAVGFSINIDGVVDFLKEEERIDESINIYFTRDRKIEALKKSRELISEGKRVELCPVDGEKYIKVGE